MTTNLNNSKPIKVTLFHANWCGHCTTFKPEWERLKKIGGADKYIEFVDYEDSKIPSELRSKVEGYPTIKISVNGNEYSHDGKRTAEDIYQSILDKIKTMRGGSRSNNKLHNSYSVASDTETDYKTITNIKGGSIASDTNKLTNTITIKMFTDEDLKVLNKLSKTSFDISL